MAVYNLETLESLIEYNKKFAFEQFKEHGELRPMVVGYTPDNSRRIVVMGSFADNPQKQAWLTMVSMIFHLHDVDKYVVMHEGWAVMKEDSDPYRYGSLAEHPDHVEVLNIVAVNRHGAKMSISQIMPDRSLEKEIVGEAAGTFCELLPQNKLSNVEKENLKKLLERLAGCFQEEELH